WSSIYELVKIAKRKSKIQILYTPFFHKNLPKLINILIKIQIFKGWVNTLGIRKK
ncbi:uncharacterized protein METZ01_LOCUS165717, partial [marine metagenome]